MQLFSGPSQHFPRASQGESRTESITVGWNNQAKIHEATNEDLVEELGLAYLDQGIIQISEIALNVARLTL